MDTRFQPGDTVRVRVDSPPHHFRTPVYIQGKVGRVAAIHGEFRNPETLAYGGDGLPRQPLYLVHFAQSDVWGQYDAATRDTLFIDIYEPWLEPVEH
ncbi:MAG: nitrile hydratase subunit beta [Deltaproteobacteria bacterium]|nr:nitrile hydratase subunit beta [Deltaproteobacteria bacterium]